MIGRWKGIFRPTKTPAGLRGARVWRLEVLAAEELQDIARSAVRLAQNRLASLLQDARLGEVHHLSSHVNVTNAALGCRQVLLRHTQVRNGVLQAVLCGTKVTTNTRHVGDRPVQGRE